MKRIENFPQGKDRSISNWGLKLQGGKVLFVEKTRFDKLFKDNDINYQLLKMIKLFWNDQCL